MCAKITSILLLSLVAATSGAAQSAADSLIASISAQRVFKDSLMRHSPDSPILREERAAFAGLNYFPVDLSYRVTGQLHTYGRRRQIHIPTTDGDSMPMERFGRFTATLTGKPFWLEVYRSLEDGSLEIFFKDETNGETTYSGGRYVRLERQEDGAYAIDFNKAYNPYCAYNHTYICPLPPPQNQLPFPIRAGERSYGTDLAH